MGSHDALQRANLERRYRRSRTLNLILAAIVALLLVVIGVQLSNDRGDASPSSDGSASSSNSDASTSDASKSEASNSGTASAEDGEASDAQCPVDDRRDPDDALALGEVDAPVVLHEWTDYRCPYCGAFARDTLPTLIEEYVDTGMVRLEVHDAALVGGENSVVIGTAARAAGEQGRYFEFFHEVYATAEARGKAELTTPQIVELAEAAGVPDLKRFESDLTRSDLREAVVSDTSEAQQAGVTGVPFFATSDCGQVTSGAQPLDSFRTMLDTALEHAKDS